MNEQIKIVQVKLNKSKHSELIAVLVMQNIPLLGAIAVFGEMENCKIPRWQYLRYQIVFYILRGS